MILHNFKVFTLLRRPAKYMQSQSKQFNVVILSIRREKNTEYYSMDTHRKGGF